MSTIATPTLPSGLRRYRFALLVLTALLVTAIAVAAFLTVNRTVAYSQTNPGVDPGVSTDGGSSGLPGHVTGDSPCWQPQVPC